MAAAGSQARIANRRVLMLVENASVPFDRRVTQEALALIEAGYEVSVICPAAPEQPLSETIEGIFVRRYRPYRARGGALSQVLEYAVALLKTGWLMAALAAGRGFDVVHACNPPDLFFVLVWPYRLLGARFIFDQHDLSPELYSTLYGRDSGAVLAVLSACERATYRSADAVIAVNESYRKIATTRGAVDSGDVFVVRNGPREGWPVACEPDEALRRGARHLVLYVGVMGFQDGVDVLLHAVATLVHDRGVGDLSVALVGDGAAREGLQQRARQLSIEDQVDFVGWVQDESVLFSYLATADVCVAPEPSSPLNDHSTFIKVTEYLAAGVPIVAFDLPETRHSAGEAALYAAPGDVEGFAAALERALTDEHARAAMRAAAAARIPELRWERQVPQLLAAYEHALAQR